MPEQQAEVTRESVPQLKTTLALLAIIPQYEWDLSDRGSQRSRPEQQFESCGKSCLARESGSLSRVNQLSKQRGSVGPVT